MLQNNAFNSEENDIACTEIEHEAIESGIGNRVQGKTRQSPNISTFIAMS